MQEAIARSELEDALKPGTLVVDFLFATSVCTTPMVNLFQTASFHDRGVGFAKQYFPEILKTYVSEGQ